MKATGYVTTAETAPAADDFPDVAEEQLVRGSLVFWQTAGPVPLDDWRPWWQWTPGASWRTPTGPGSTLGGLEMHPVLHVSFEDALAYAQWAGKALPTEVEWEYAARAGGPTSTYAWGEEFMPPRPMANTWQGRFPWENLKPAGRDRTTAVARFPPNAWGLVDMIGNVWEWTTSTFTDSHLGRPGDTHSCCGPTGVLSEDDRRVMKGGSHLCAASYCLRYRPPARQGGGAQQHQRSRVPVCRARLSSRKLIDPLDRHVA